MHIPTTNSNHKRPSKISRYTVEKAASSPKQLYRKTEFCSQSEERKENRGSLSAGEVQELYYFLRTKKFPVTDKEGHLELGVQLFYLMQKMRYFLKQKGILISGHGIRLGGSIASNLLLKGKIQDSTFCDIDLSIYLERKEEKQSIEEDYQSYSFFFLQVLHSIEQAMQELITEQTGVTLSLRNICDSFFWERLRVHSSEESWSLISLGSPEHMNIDLKFIQKSRRSYAFSTDSFEIVLDSFLTYNRFPSRVPFHSLYGNVEEALKHLTDGKLKTKNPHQIRRGLFRYCLELAKGRTCETPEEKEELQTIFSTAFFADFNTSNLQDFTTALNKFLAKHTKYANAVLEHLYIVLQHAEHSEKSEFLLTIIEHQKSYKK